MHACTDITGNGLIGHAIEIADASRVGMEFRLGPCPFYEAAPELAVGGKFPGGTFANYRYFSAQVDVAETCAESRVWLLYDAQTSGGLLAALPPAQADEALQALLRAVWRRPSSATSSPSRA